MRFWSRVRPALHKLARPLGLWLGLTGLAGAVCPCCGQAICPANLLGAGLVGLLLTASLRLWRWLAPSARLRAQDTNETFSDRTLSDRTLSD